MPAYKGFVGSENHEFKRASQRINSDDFCVHFLMSYEFVNFVELVKQIFFRASAAPAFYFNKSFSNSVIALINYCDVWFCESCSSSSLQRGFSLNFDYVFLFYSNNFGMGENAIF